MATPVNQLTLYEAQELFFYDDTDGNLYWKIRPSQALSWGSKAGYLRNDGYKAVKIKGKEYKVHNIIWNWHFGEIPKGKEVDHVDRNRSSNRLINLRLSNSIQQSVNSSHKGFYWSKCKNVWRARFKKRELGTFPTALQARLAYEKARVEAEPEFATSFFTDAILRICSV